MMTAKRRTALKYTLLTAAAGLIVAGWLALGGACGPAASPSPAAPGGASGATLIPTATPTIWWLGDTPSPAELATLEAIPTATPYPPGYIYPTDPPYVPPLTNTQIGATLAAEIATPTPTIWILGDTSPSELATAMAAPSATALPDDFVWPTAPPPLTIEDVGATLAANIATAQAQQASEAAAETPTPEPAPTPTPLPLTEQVTQFARDMQGRYSVVARIKAEASRTVSIPDNLAWPHNTTPWGEDSVTRTPVTVVTTYYGIMPAGYELVTPPAAPNAAPEAGQEYVFFIRNFFVSDNSAECSGARVQGGRFVTTRHRLTPWAGQAVFSSERKCGF